MSLPTIPNSSNQALQSPNGERTSFPQELIDIIIDHLHDDKPSLYACSVVCHSWLPSTRYHLFYAIDITCSLLHSTEQYHRLLACLEESPQLASYIQDLKVDHTSWCIGSEGAENLLSAICSKLKDVRTLTLQRVYIPALPAHLKESLCALFALPTLRRLSLVEFNVQTFLELATLLTACSRLIYLVLFQIRWEDCGGIESLGGLVRPSVLDSRRIRQATAPELPPDTHCFSPRELKLGGVSYRNSRSLLNFLGESVEDFELDDIFGHHRFEVDKAADFIALDSMSSLRTLRLNPSQSILSNPGSWVISLLSSLKASNCMEAISIHSKEFHLKSRPGVLDWEWYRAVDETLSCSTFPKLCRVDVEVISFGQKDPPGVRDLRSFFPQLGNRGILRTHFQYKAV